MKKTLIRILWVMAIAMIAIPTYSQSNMSKEKMDMLRRRAAEKVGNLGEFIRLTAYKDPKLTTEKQMKNKRYYRTAALNLLIFQGEEYDETAVEILSDGTTKETTIHKEGVMMEVSSLSSDTTARKTVKEYLDGLLNLSYAQVDIKTTEVANIEVSKLQKYRDDMYVCTCYFEQEFRGYNKDGIPQYKDITKKRVKCYIKVEETEDGEEYVIMLGDISVVETRRLG